MYKAQWAVCLRFFPQSKKNEGEKIISAFSFAIFHYNFLIKSTIDRYIGILDRCLKLFF